MEFPSSPRVIYQKNPLVEVVTQVRFTPILRIIHDLPVSFQEAVRKAYPVFQTRQEQTLAFGFGSSVSEETPPRQSTTTIYDFLSADRVWRISLSSNFVALTTARYSVWEEFRQRTEQVLTLTQEIYEPSMFTRLGLRYVDLIARSAIGLEGVAWRDLLSSHICGIVSTAVVSDNDVEGYEANIRLAAKEGHITLRHGFVTNATTKEQAYFIDVDFYSDSEVEANLNDALTRLDRYNGDAGQLFRWCIGPKLHHAMDPKPV